MPKQLDITVVEPAQHGIVLAPVSAPPAPEPGDQHLWVLLAARADRVLIIGDRRLQRDRAMGTRVCRNVMILGEPQSIPTISPGSVGFR